MVHAAPSAQPRRQGTQPSKVAAPAAKDRTEEQQGSSQAPRMPAWKIAFWAPVGYLFITQFLGIASIEGDSMSPTLNAEADRKSPWGNAVVLLNRSVVSRLNSKIGDIVTLRSPLDPDLLITKRILALEGDTIRVTRHVHGRATGGSSRIRVPPGHAWVEGDASAHEQEQQAKGGKRLSLSQSRDSREYGPVPVGLITSRVSFVLWPPSKIGRPADRPGFDVEQARAIRHARTVTAVPRGGGKAHPQDSSLTPYTEDDVAPILKGITKRALEKKQREEEDGELEEALRKALNSMSRGGRLGIDRGAVL